MIFQKRDIQKELVSFVESSQFENFKLIMEDYSLTKFKEIQKYDPKKGHADLIADRQVLNWFMSLPATIEKRVEYIKKKESAEAQKRIDEYQST